MKTPSRAGVGIDWNGIGATVFGSKLGPQPGESGSVGAAGFAVVPPALIVYCVPVRPFDVISCAKRIPGVRAQNLPAESRIAVRGSGA